MKLIETNFYLNNLLFTILVFFVVFLIDNIIKKSIDVIFSGVKKQISHERMLAKTRTVRNILKGIVDIFLFLTALLISLSHWGINIIPILTGASILGLAISFGSQTLIKDLISGFFILLEDQYSVGDMIKISSYEGEVYRITLRLTILKDNKGNLIYIPNSQITTVTRLKKIRHTILP